VEPVQRKENLMTDDAEGADNTAVFAAWLNHIPETMQATRTILEATATGTKELGVSTDQKIHELARQVTALNISVIQLEHRLELDAGREGLPADALNAIASEFLP
jgi:outer membrane murein-binding lipoprotein Lpp